MGIILTALTYTAYIFIIIMYTRKAVCYARMPPHLRWDLYPVMHESRCKYGGSYYEDPEWWTKPRRKNYIKSILFIIKDNFYLGEYFHLNRGYWIFLLPWHFGFILIIMLHILCFWGALAMLMGVSVSNESTNFLGKVFYYSILLIGVGSFVAGSLGSIGMVIKRLSDRSLRAYASPMHYFNYLFLLAFFLSGLYVWYFKDPTFSEYREFWKGLITFNPKHVAPAAAIHIALFALLLFYLPFTRSMHYITRFFAFLWVRWDDEPNLRGSRIEKRVQKWHNQPLNWSAPHIQTGKRWADLTSDLTFSGQIKDR
ncbi:MAG: respiratory nitrate reductase subunit gamma [Thermodesulfobacteriota bacterium]|jgi:nitrate reductase gamma subunit